MAFSTLGKRLLREYAVDRRLKTMARPIEPTPKLKGEDARRLLADLERTAAPSVIAERQRQAEVRLGQAFGPLGVPKVEGAKRKRS